MHRCEERADEELGFNQPCLVAPEGSLSAGVREVAADWETLASGYCCTEAGMGHCRRGNPAPLGV